jgi:hypothetical protein
LCLTSGLRLTLGLRLSLRLALSGKHAGEQRRNRCGPNKLLETNQHSWPPGFNR